MQQVNSLAEFIKIRELEAQLQSVSLCNEKWEFFFDETGNCRKFRLAKGGSFNNTNALSHYFILGGLAFDSKEDAQSCNPQSFINSLHLGTNFSELKSNMLCPADWAFENFIKHDRVSKLISWIYNSKACIHYSVENNLYFALVDIVDSLNLKAMYEYHLLLKDALYRAAKQHLDEFAEFLSNYDFPDISKTELFWKNLTYLLDDFAQNDSILANDSWFTILRSMVRDNARHPAQQENTLITNNEKYELQDSYLPFYQRHCYTFLYSYHNFDEEKTIISQMKLFPFENYQFLDSKNEPLIQVSDCFVSTLSKILFFFDSKSLNEIEIYSKVMDAKSKENYRKLFDVIMRSQKKSPFLTHSANAVSVMEDHAQKWELVIK
ncbi:hypothetical protein SAMN05720487_107101 [Fibrobacter sp. UWT2]|uniref:DUF3800 domain-containing protein n=1 Tax=Fibrobacter sp. UWT2 TaxID=1896224 RepID=UPI000921FD77|nr:DUF3800 domain-containing protein [Fibrobacter sp. UWT2]SHL06232.1 hypothetical protein SAMN05720487_107101 [Fibrobacter sp. UWT2]